MTYCMDMLVQLNKKTGWKIYRCSYTATGVEATLIDTRDGQLYDIVIKPQYITLSQEAIEQEVI